MVEVPRTFQHSLSASDNMLFLELLFTSFLYLSAVNAKICPDEPCAIRCLYGLAHDQNGCQLCECLPNPCALVLCEVGTKCDVVLNESCEGVDCEPYKAICTPICPDEPCAIRCLYGLAHDENGCQLCECLPNPCAAAQCLTGTTCEVVPNDSCEGTTCPPFKAVCSLPTSCKPPLCEILCLFGFENGKTGCPICKCKLNPCATVKCSSNYTCQAQQLDNCKKPPCPYRGVCVYNCPMLKCRECMSGNVVDENGCRTCQCKDPCEGVTCSDGQVCVADSLAKERYSCSPNTDLCCKKPTPPNNCTASYNACQTCFKDCTTMKCGGSTRCCPDYFGCYGCRQAIPCRPVV